MKLSPEVLTEINKDLEDTLLDLFINNQQRPTLDNRTLAQVKNKVLCVVDKYIADHGEFVDINKIDTKLDHETRMISITGLECLDGV